MGLRTAPRTWLSPPHGFRGAGPVASLLRALVIALILPLASAGSLPLWAQLAGVEGPHVCHCSTERHDCICSKCNPDQDQMALSSESLKGQCGDDDVIFGGKAICAVLSGAWSLAPIGEHVVPLATMIDPRGLTMPPPPTPPPRLSSSSAA